MEIRGSDIFNIWFQCKDKTFCKPSSNERISYDHMVNNNGTYCGITSAYAFDSNHRQWKQIRTYINLDACTMTTLEGVSYPFSRCMLCINPVSKYSSDWCCNISSFTNLDAFRRFDKCDNYVLIQSYISNCHIPNVVTSCYDAFLKDSSEPYHVLFESDNNVCIPAFLHDLFGTNSSVIVEKKIDQTEDIIHSIELLDSFKLIVQWMKHLVVKREWPNIDEMLKHGFDKNSRQWLKTAIFFDIPIFVTFFTELIKISNQNI